MSPDQNIGKLLPEAASKGDLDETTLRKYAELQKTFRFGCVIAGMVLSIGIIAAAWAVVAIKTHEEKPPWLELATLAVPLVLGPAGLIALAIHRLRASDRKTKELEEKLLKPD